MKRLGYYLFNIFYYIFYLIPINENKILLIMTHDESPEGNVLYTANYFKSKNSKLFFKEIKKEDYNFKYSGSLLNFLKKLIKFFIFKPYHVATSKTILLDNIFLPFAYTKFKKEVNIIQLWHGTGTIKKFALDSETGLIKKLASKSCFKYTHLIVGSDEMVPIYESAFKMERHKIFPIGSPRTDLFFDKEFINKKVEEFYNKYPKISNKKIILYAPTFRDNNFKIILNDKVKLSKFNLDENLDLNLDIFNILKYLDSEYVLLLKLHPVINKNFSMNNLNLSEDIKNRVYDFSKYSINSLMFISDCLITDYSSIIFEYSLLNKKIIFYSYDLEEFERYSRGFYFNYENFIPGPQLTNIKDISKEIRKVGKTNTIDPKLQSFKKKYMNNCDGKSKEKIYSILKREVG